MQRLEVREPVPYPILVGEGVLKEVPPLAGPAALLFDRRVEGFAQEVAKALGVRHLLGLPGGEAAKSLEVYGKVLSWLAEKGLPRNATLLVVGGGTLTDLGGFVAATYLRGVAYLAFPTTTLAIVDASVGGKTGINLPEGKNLVGAFHFPQGVYAELRALKTLPLPTFKEGLVEAFKHGLIAGDEALLKVEDLTPQSPRLEAFLAKAVAVKVRVTEEDPLEKGKRRLLNLGHTLGLRPPLRRPSGKGPWGRGPFAPCAPPPPLALPPSPAAFGLGGPPPLPPPGQEEGFGKPPLGGAPGPGEACGAPLARRPPPGGLRRLAGGA